jgi:hypothetical protein
VARLSVRACSWLHVWVEKRGEGRGGYPCIFVDRSGVKSSFHVSFCSGDCGEDGRGDLPFAAGYGVRRSWLSPSLAMERGAVSALATTHSRDIFSSFSSSPPQTLAAATRLFLFVAAGRNHLLEEQSSS